MHADWILYNGAMRTMDVAMPLAEALAVKDERICAVGRTQEMEALAGSTTRRLDLAGRTVLPGFIDAHVHFTGHGLRLQRVNLAGAESLEEALARVRDAVGHVREGEWLLGAGWNYNEWLNPVRPTAADLERVAPRVPVALSSKDGHSIWLNAAALRLAGINASTPEMPGGQILRDAAGNPTGILTERAQELVYRFIPEPGAAQLLVAARAAVVDAARLGITGVHNCEGPQAFTALQQLAETGELSVRVWHMLPMEMLDAALKLGLRTGYGNEWLRIGHVKMFADGALGSRTAEMLAPYEGEPTNYGVAVHSSEELYAAASAAARGGLASAIHAIGDAANRRVLDIYERLAAEGLSSGLRQRIEHVQVLAPDDIARFARLGVVASMQPIHATSDMEMAERHWGARSAGAYVWRSLWERGTVLAFGSDCPVEAPDPLLGLHAAVTRRRADGSPGPEGWYPEERLTAEQAVRGFTWGPAYAAGKEDRLGSLTPGKLADVTILDRDILALPSMEILQARVLGTIVGGRFAWRDGLL